MRFGSVHLNNDANEQIADLLHKATETHRVACSFVFGRVASGDNASELSPGLIVLLNGSRPSNQAIQEEILLGDKSVSLSILDYDDLERLLKRPSWQYRLLDCAPVLPVTRELQRWLVQLRNVLTSAEARWSRITSLALMVEELSATADCYLERFAEGGSLYARALAFSEAILLACECSGTLPFEAGNPLLTLERTGALDQIGCKWPLPPYSADGDLSKRWASLHELLQSARDLVWPRPSRIEKGEAALLTRDDLKSGTVEALAQLFLAAQWRHGEHVAAATAAVSRQARSAEVTRTSTSPLRQAAHPVPKCDSREARAQEYSARRRRLKVIIPTGGCRVRSCIFCELPRLALKPAIDLNWEALIPQPDGVVDQVVIYTDGSFFDDRELRAQDRKQIIDRVRQLGATRLCVETLPRFLSEEKIVELGAACGSDLGLTVGVGLQSTNQHIRETVLGTPIRDEHWQHMLALRSRMHFSLRVFLLFGKPLLSSTEDAADVLTSIDDLASALVSGDEVTVNQLWPTRFTLVEQLERVGLVEVPDLCILRETLDRARLNHPGLRIAPGCVSVRTCTSSPAATVASLPNVCEPCLQVLRAAERDEVHLKEPCSRKDLIWTRFPWPALGSLQNRCEFAKKRIYGEVGDECNFDVSSEHDI